MKSYERTRKLLPFCGATLSVFDHATLSTLAEFTRPLAILQCRRS